MTFMKTLCSYFLSLIFISTPLSLMVSIPDPISSGVARTWFGFHYQEQNKESEYYSFNVMHIDSDRKDHGLLTQLHGSYEPYAHWDFDFGQEIVQKKSNFYSRSKTIGGKRNLPVPPTTTPDPACKSSEFDCNTEFSCK